MGWEVAASAFIAQLLNWGAGNWAQEAERLATLNDELRGKVRQQQLDEQMGAVLAETQKLKDVADEFEKVGSWLESWQLN